MSEEIKKKIEEINKAFEEFKKRNDQAIEEAETRNGEATAETREVVERINTDVTAIKDQLKELEVRANRPNFGPNGEQADDPEMELRKKSLEKYIRYGTEAMEVEEKRALSSVSDGDGGFLVPVDFENTILMNAYDEAEIRSQCVARPTGRDTVFMGALSKPSVAWGRANVAVTAQNLSAGGERISIFDLKALALIHNNTLDDSAADIFGEIGGAFGLAVAEAEDDAFAVGGGDDSPKGITSDSRVQANHVVSGVAADITDASNNGIDALLGVYYTPKKTYRRNGVWAWKSSVELKLRKLKDDDGRYLWQPPVQAGTPATFLGKSVINPEGLPSVAAGAYPVVFGDFKHGYAIRDRAGLVIKRLEERYAEYDQTGILIKKRVGGQVIKAEAFACLKIAA